MARLVLGDIKHGFEFFFALAFIDNKLITIVNWRTLEIAKQQKVRLMIKIKAEKVFYYLEILDEAKLSPLLPSATKLLQGNVFTHVCHSVHGGVFHTPSRQTTSRQTPLLCRHPQQTPLPRQTPPSQADTLGQTPFPWRHPLHSACWDTINKRAVRILLECILVLIIDTFEAFIYCKPHHAW